MVCPIAPLMSDQITALQSSVRFTSHTVPYIPPSPHLAPGNLRVPSALRHLPSPYTDIAPKAGAVVPLFRHKLQLAPGPDSPGPAVRAQSIVERLSTRTHGPEAYVLLVMRRGESGKDSTEMKQRRLPRRDEGILIRLVRWPNWRWGV